MMGTAARARLTLCSLFLFLGLSFAQTAAEGDEAGTLNVGVILNMRSLAGKMSRTSILMAMEDFYAVHRDHATRLVLRIRDSNGGGNIKAASAAIDLLENHHVQAIIGPEKSAEATFVSDIGNNSQVPVISFTATNPALSSAIA